MANMLKEFEKLLRLALDRKVTMHRKLMMYLLCLILAALGILLLLLTAIGGPLKAEPQISQVMENQLSSVSDKVSEELETYTGYGLQLSRELGQDIEDFLDEKGISVSDLNDQPGLLLEIQKMMYSLPHCQVVNSIFLAYIFTLWHNISKKFLLERGVSK